ncbi:hypothetical protein CANINC_002452 [Pichia inconspicua]|uniref:RRM domain-containing protein n=1 Tax=Pichia inconspicua TaxID=52247 RepID=A0A4T0X143_9ASCO|nr:hypothetical protein CANINC_002452 [[Candida] inconspicua]
MVLRSIHTLYAKNLNEKVSLNKLHDSLKTLFTDAGFQVLHIQACKNLALRGQAYISFNKNVDLNQVIETLNTKLLFDKPIVLQVAKQNSDVVLERFSSHSEYQEFLGKVRKERLDRRSSRIGGEKRKRGELEDKDMNSGENTKKRKVAINTVPNKMMIITNLSEDVTQKDLIDLLSKYDGFLTANYVSVRHLALIEFESEQDAIKCYKELGSDVMIKGKSSLLTYAKK